MRSMLVSATLGLSVLLGAGGIVRGDSLNGSGSSFVGPLMGKWAREYEKARDVKINYTPTGSGAGVRQVLEKEVDFGCSDAPLTEEQVKKAVAGGGDVLHIPLAMGGVVPAYNLADIKDPLR